MDKVILHGMVPRQEVLSAVRGAGASVVITSMGQESSRSDRGIVTGKVFEALGLKTPVLGITPPGSDLESILKLTGAGPSFRGDQIDEIAHFLKALMNGRKLQPKSLESYSWPSLAFKVDTLLRGQIPMEPQAERRDVPKPRVVSKDLNEAGFTG
jgi:hypothetical protein